MQSEFGEFTETRTKSGLRRYQIEIRHKGLNKYKVVRGDNSHVVEQKARAEMAHWDQMWKQRQAKERKAATIQEKKQQSLNKTEEAGANLISLEKTLIHTLSINDQVDWESLKNKRNFPKPKPNPGQILPEPKKEDLKYQVNLNLLDRLFSSRRLKKEQLAQFVFMSDHKKWAEVKETIEKRHKKELGKWEQEKAVYLT